MVSCSAIVAFSCAVSSTSTGAKYPTSFPSIFIDPPTKVVRPPKIFSTGPATIEIPASARATSLTGLGSPANPCATVMTTDAISFRAGTTIGTTACPTSTPTVSSAALT